MIYIVLVNWNGWKDTIECLESLLRLRYENFRILVCDNASDDRSLDRIAEWAEGKLAAESSNPALQHLISPPVPKPVPFLRISLDEKVNLAEHSEKLALIQAGSNLGFAGGNNVGLALALQAGDLEYAWVLNNDTVVDPQALSALVERMEQRPDAGMCGSTLLHYYDPASIQALGGSTLNHWLARVGHIGLKQQNHRSRLSVDEVERRMQYVVGASIFVRRSFLDRVGLMDERYFLYFEEADWAIRAKPFFSLAYCPASLVYHKEGSSIGTANVKNKRRSELSERFASRNRILFTRTHYPASLATVIPLMLISALHRLATGKLRNFRALLQGMASGLFAPGKPAAREPDCTGETGGAILR